MNLVCRFLATAVIATPLEYVCVLTEQCVHFLQLLLLSSVGTSLEWDTFEQICVWQLLNSEEPPVLSVVDLLPDLYKSGISLHFVYITELCSLYRSS